MRFHTLTEFSTIFFKKENALHLSLVFPFFIWVILSCTEIILHFTLIPGLFASVSMPFSIRIAAIFNNMFLSLLVLLIFGFPQYIIFYGLLRILKSFRTIKKFIKTFACLAFSFFIMFQAAGWAYFIMVGRFPSLIEISSWLDKPFDSIDLALNSYPALVIYIPMLSILLAAFLLYTLNRGILLRPGASFRKTVLMMPIIIVILGVTTSILFTTAKQNFQKGDTKTKNYAKARYIVERKTSPLLSLKADYFTKKPKAQKEEMPAAK